MTISKLARAVGRSRSAVIDWESDRRPPLKSSWIRIRAVLGRIPGQLPQNYGRRLLILRRQLGLTQGEFAARLGVTKNTIANLEHHRKPPKRSTQRKLLAMLKNPDRPNE
jgi:transcriptional regulator with XRE-family HTH domain